MICWLLKANRGIICFWFVAKLHNKLQVWESTEIATVSLWRFHMTLTHYNTYLQQSVTLICLNICIKNRAGCTQTGGQSRVLLRMGQLTHFIIGLKDIKRGALPTCVCYSIEPLCRGSCEREPLTFLFCAWNISLWCCWPACAVACLIRSAVDA